MEINLRKMFSGLYEGKKILITGDTGFKGSWLAIWLQELGATVYGYALPPKTKRDNFVLSNLNEKIEHLDGDIRDLDKLLTYFNKVKPDIAFHLAAQPLVLDSLDNPHYTFETNLMGTVNFFEAVRHIKSVKVAINVTSDKCYQNNEWIWGYRENDPMGGKDPYSASKGCSELITTSYIDSFFKDTECNIASVRAGNVIGAGDWADFRIVPDYFRAKIKKEKLVIRNPDATRPWQHVLEPLGGYLFLASKLVSRENFNGGWNFGPKDEMNYTVYSLVEKMTEIDKSVKIQFSKNNNKNNEANLLKLDISKAVSKLGWTPVLNFNDTVRFTVDGYLSDIDKNDAYENRVNTIKEYINIGNENKINWIIGK